MTRWILRQLEYITCQLAYQAGRVLERFGYTQGEADYRVRWMWWMNMQINDRLYGRLILMPDDYDLDDALAHPAEL